jgi:hypothetical protein
MTSVTFGPWTLDVDIDATRDTYAQISDGAEACGCDHCEDWARVRSRTIPQEVRDFLAGFGIDWRREAEVYELDPRRASHLCAGWFHAVGRIEHGPRHSHKDLGGGSGEIVMPDTVRVADGYEAYVHDDLPPMKPAMRAGWKRGLPVFTVEFQTSRHHWEGGEDG